MSNLIEVKNFSKSFGSKKVHNNLNFEVLKGECLGLIGGSGTGKSVLLRSLIGLEKPDSGQILFDGQDIVPLSEDEYIPVRKKIAYAFQGGALFDSMSVFENLAYPLREHTSLNDEQIKQKITILLDRFGLKNADGLYPAQLSGGMQKRVGLARAIILEPKVILYDEPTAGLDPQNTLKIQEMILDLKATGVTSIFVTHDMPVAFAVCDRIVFLSGGSIKTIDTIENIKANPQHTISQFAKGIL